METAALSASASERVYSWSGEFADAQTEAQFREGTWNETVERTRSIQIAIWVFAGWGVVDYLLFGPSWIFVCIFVARILSIAVGRLPLKFFPADRKHVPFFAKTNF